MYDATTLKPAIIITESTVECPVSGCNHVVSRQRKRFQRLEKFMCPEHRIYISPSTFEYNERLNNILWKERPDLELLFNRIGIVKREINRIARDNSEDAVTWNIFRYLEKQKLLKPLLSKIAGYVVVNPEIIYWSYCQSENSIWSELHKAHLEFETNPEKGSEPDVIIQAKNALFLIEAKLNAKNETTPSSNSPQVEERYTKGGNNWYRTIFNSEFKAVAVTNKKYELLRFWLLGSWIARNLNVNYFLINLVPSQKEQTIKTAFGKHIIEEQRTGNQKRAFKRITWEGIYNFILSITKEPSFESKAILDYFRYKTVGYDSNGILQKAFSI
jgi:hypothetical protein